MNGSFYEQLGGVAGAFEQWGACERTVVACALARRVPWPGLRLLQRAVDEALSRAAPDASRETAANDEPAVAALLAQATDDDDDEGDGSLHKLVALLPLLRSDNLRVKDAYVTAAPALVQRCVDAPRSAAAADLCRQLLSYLLVHPALTHGDQRTLTQWLRYLENHISGNRTTESVWQQRIEPCLVSENIWSNSNPFRRTIGKNVEFRSVVDSVDYNSELLQESFSKNGRDVDISNESEKLNFDATISQPKSQRSNSLTPPSSNFMSSSAENLSDEPFVQKPRSFSLSSEHSLQIRPLIMYGTTGSETRLDDLRSNNFTEHPGMSTVAQWLKSLRLHKYVWLFTNISYDQMMAMDEKYLEKLGVTKGARHKILVSIRKLSERSLAVGAVAAELRAGVGGAGGAARALERLRTALLGPMPPHSPLPHAIVQVLHLAVGAMVAELRAGVGGAGGAARALERLRTALLGPMPPHSPLPHAIVQVLHLASKCLNANGAGTASGAGPAGPGPGPGQGGLGPGPAGEGELDAPDPLSLHCWLVEKALHHEAFNRPELVEALKRLRHRLPPRQFYHHVGDLPHRHRPKPRWRINPHTYKPSQKRWSLSGAAAVPPPQPRGKSNSYPPYPPPPQPLLPPPAPDDYSGLDALCLQMTEQAID